MFDRKEWKNRPENKEKQKAYCKKYRENNLEKIRKHDRERRLNGGHPVSKEYARKYYLEVVKPKRQVKKLEKND
jgi:hypothetical protein